VSLRCRVLGHRWAPLAEIRYVLGPAETWVCDEVCSRCGAETWWPA
jgi:hypothetical protein